jgi:hypothetical protein
MRLHLQIKNKLDVINKLASTLIPVFISSMLGGILYLLILSFNLDNIVKMTITLLVVFTSYTLINETIQSRNTD